MRKILIANTVCALALAFASPTAGAAVYSFDVSGLKGNLNNDCSGYFGSDFDECNITIDGEALSPVIAKWDKEDWDADVANGVTPTLVEATEEPITSEINNTSWASVSGLEFSITQTSTDPESYRWDYDPGDDDPVIKYWAKKQSAGFTLYWNVDEDPNSLCDADQPTLACMQLATTITSGTWGGDWSHITWYDTEAPCGGADCSGPLVPLPAAGFLFLTALGGMGLFRRFRRVTG